MRRTSLTFMLLVGLILTAGCRSGQPVILTPLADETFIPARFSLGLTVMGPDAGEQEISLRPARYILEADGHLRAAIGEGSTPKTFPPIARRLDDRQMAGLWAIVDDAGILDDPDPARVGNPALIDPPRSGTIAVVSVRAGERARSSMFELVSDDPEADRILPLIRDLARLAWVDR